MVQTLGLKITHLTSSQENKEDDHNNGLDALDSARTALLSIDVAGGAGDVELEDAELQADTPGEIQYAFIEFTGALTGNRTITVPDRSNWWRFHNNTTGDFTLTVQTALGSGVEIQQGNWASLRTDGTDVINLLEDLLGGIVDVEIKTTTYDIKTIESFKSFTNEGATGNPATRPFNLPAAEAGLRYFFINHASADMRVVAATGDTIRIAATESASAGNIQSNAVGDTVQLIAINATEWFAIAVNGTWSFDV